jgi:endonuclease G
MKKIISVVISMFISAVVTATPIDEKCPELASKYGSPTPVGKSDGIYECHVKYAVLVSPTLKDPIFVIEHLTKDGLKCTVTRKNNFHADLSLPAADRATPEDYNKSGYDQGHMASAQDQCDNAADESESFLMTNMVPQDPNNNRGIWKKLEMYSRALAQGDNVYVISGPVFVGTKHKTIGNGVVVPEQLFKIVYDDTTDLTQAWILPNAAIPSSQLKKYEASVTQIESVTGLVIFPKKK